MKISNFERKNVIIFLVLILLLIFRFFTSWYAPFGEDQYLIYDKVSEFFNTRIIPPYSIYVPITQDAYIPGPAISIIYSLFYFISQDPVVVGMMTQVLQLLGILVLYFLFKELFSKKTAILVSFAMLLSPWLSYYGAGIWNPSLIFVFSSIVFFALWKIYKTKKTIYWGLLSFGVCMASQVHMSAFLLILIVLVFIIYYRLWPSIKAVLFSLFIFIVLFFPYIKYEILNNFSNTLALLGKATGSEFKAESLFRALHFSVIFTSSEIAHFAGAGIKRALVFYGHNLILSIFFIPMSLLTAYISYVIFVRFIRNNFSLSIIRSRPWVLLFLLSFVINPLIYYFTPRPFSPHNLIVIAPFLWIPIAWFIEHGEYGKFGGRLYFLKLKFKYFAIIYAVSSIIATYMILVSNPNQVPVRDVLKVVEFIGRTEHSPIKLSGYQDMTTTLAPVETIHANYFARKNKLISSKNDEAMFSFVIIDKRRSDIRGNVVFETSTCVVIKD